MAHPNNVIKTIIKLFTLTLTSEIKKSSLFKFGMTNNFLPACNTTILFYECQISVH